MRLKWQFAFLFINISAAMRLIWTLSYRIAVTCF
jgi:hypothetical protein